MGTKLNPDGAKIRAFRIQRGWTQEQLAEIAGISLRTVQRAEAANSAAFETMKAIAAAFETDFDRMLKQEPIGAADQKTQPIVSPNVSCSEPANKQIVSKGPALTVRRVWPALIIAVSALAVGLIIGISAKSRVNKQSQSLPIASHSVSKALPDSQKPFSESQFQNMSPRTLSKSKAVSDSAIEAATSNFEIAGNDEDSSLPDAAIPTARPADTSETSSLELIQPSSSPDLQSLRMIPMPLVVPDEPVSETALSDTSGHSMQQAQASGSVRQAVGLAVKKTGGFVSKARASIKRAF